MSAVTAAFAESGHGILTGMGTRPRSMAGDPMTLGNMRANGVRSLDVSCWQCHHRTILSGDPLAEIKVLTEPARIALVIKDGAIAANRMKPSR
jgi:hypothetical protein